MIRRWWDNAREDDQAAVLMRLQLNSELAGVPWAFLPEQVQSLLARRVRINEQLLTPGWRKV
jgi:hypothetical protein